MDALKLMNETLVLYSFIESYIIFHHFYNNPQDLLISAYVSYAPENGLDQKYRKIYRLFYFSHVELTDTNTYQLSLLKLNLK